MTVTQPLRIADNVPGQGVTTNEGFHRAVAFDRLNPNSAYAWGGGSLGAGNLVRLLWRYDFDIDTWTNTGLASLPAAGRKYLYRTSGSHQDRLIATGTTSPGTSMFTEIYNVALNTWTTTPTTGVPAGFGFVGCAIGQNYHLLSHATHERLDILNPAGGWTALTAPNAIPAGTVQGGVLIPDPLDSDRLILFTSGDSTRHMQAYSISGDSWTTLGSIWPETFHASFVFGIPGTGVIAARRDFGIPDFTLVRVRRLVFTGPSTAEFQDFGEWADTTFDSGYNPMQNWNYAATVDNSGQNRIIFGSGFTSSALNQGVQNRWWGGEASALGGAATRLEPTDVAESATRTLPTFRNPAIAAEPTGLVAGGTRVDPTDRPTS